MENAKDEKNVTRILAERRSNGAVILAEHLPYNRDNPHRYAVKCIQVRYFPDEARALKFAREKYGMEWKLRAEQQNAP